MPPFAHVTIIGLGLIGSSVARAVKANIPGARITGYDGDENVRRRAEDLGFCDAVSASAAAAVEQADLVLLAVPVGAMGSVAGEFAGALPKGAIVSDVGSCKQSVARALTAALPGAIIIPAHPVAGTEKSGPDAGFTTLFQGRWCILTPPEDAPEEATQRLIAFWQQLGANVEIMDARHHDMVLAITSHLPHLIAYTIVGTADDLSDVTQSEVIKYSAGGFRDFTRIAASDPVMWRDVFLSNKEAVLEMLQRFSEDLTALQRAIRYDKGEELEVLFTRTRNIRRSIVEQGQDDDAPDFGRKH
ncbi:MAG: prephenate/arogenate dehydrogenase family protein [Sphingomonadales bacterium]|nr:prephenate/arogenate dehydrogenase family protein [Sphingomonadales bacterium]